MTDTTSWVHVARLVRPQGRCGEILADILTDYPERFARMRNAFLDREGGLPPTPVILECSWLHQGRVVLKFEGIDSIAAAESLRGADLVIPMEERIALDADTVYISDLIGCELVDFSRHGHPIVGIVRDVVQQETTTDLIVVADPDGVEHLIPFARAYLVRIDLPGHRLEMNLPAGLLEVNKPIQEEERLAQKEE